MEKLLFKLNAAIEANGRPCECLYVGRFDLSDRGQVLEVTEEMLDQVVTNFEDLGESGRIPLSVNHNTGASTLEEARAVGWVVRMFLKSDNGRLSLMMEPRWLEDARQFIEQEAFKFLSVGMVLRDTNTETGEGIGAHVREISLTNTPCIPGLAPIELSHKTGKTGLRQRLAELNQRVNALGGGSNNMSGDPVDQFWKLTDQLLAADPKLHPSEARAKAIAQNPRLAALAQIPGAAKGQRRAKPAENSRHYYDLFFSKAKEIEQRENCSFEESRLKAARQFPALRLAAFATDPRERFQAARKFENETNGLGLAAAHQRAALHLAADAVEVAL